jgi:DNA-binding LacI/PurR family transcriptional regulator
MINPDARWFAQAGAQDPERAVKAWRDWLGHAQGKQSDGAKHRKALELATGLSRAAIGFYFTDQHQISNETRERLGRLMTSLGARPVLPPPIASRAASRAARVVILAELTNVPSPRFHLDVFAACARALSYRGIACALHEVVADAMERSVTRIARDYRPTGAIFLRLTPTTTTSDVLRRYNVPVVLIHAHDHPGYGPPVLANIIPGFNDLAEGVKIWVRALPKSRNPIVVVRMSPESRDSVRQKRLDAVILGLEGSQIKEFPVPDYSFRHALKVVTQFPKARAYVCLSDELAVGIKKVLEAKGENPGGRILGYDNSRLAELEGISSFGQRIDDTAERAVEILTRWIGNVGETQREWPQAVTDRIQVAWARRL